MIEDAATEDLLYTADQSSLVDVRARRTVGDLFHQLEEVPLSSNIVRLSFVVSLIALFVGTVLIVAAGTLSLGNDADATILRRLGIIGGVLFYPGLAGFFLWLLSLLFRRSND